MKENIKAALLSALVLPGVGQIFRGHKLKGGILILSVTILLLAAFILAAVAMQDVLHGSGSAGTMDPVAVAGRLRTWIPAALWLAGALLCLWVYGIADALLSSGKNECTGDGNQASGKTDFNR
jgi:hypothetical protein